MLATELRYWSKPSPTHFISNICHQHRCSRLIVALIHFNWGFNMLISCFRQNAIKFTRRFTRFNRSFLKFRNLGAKIAELKLSIAYLAELKDEGDYLLARISLILVEHDFVSRNQCSFAVSIVNIKLNEQTKKNNQKIKIY